MRTELPDVDGVAARFITSLTKSGFTQTPSAPLTDADSSLTFVNANITPFKPRLIAGDTIGATCQEQACVRAHGEFPFLFAFGMLGTITDFEHFDLVCRTVPAALLAAMPWGRPEDLVVAIDERDHDLITGMADLLGRGARLRLVSEGEIDTRWQYGAGAALTGRGLTIIYTGKDTCGEGCRPRCWCGRWQELGNIIVIDTPNRQYVETGFGLESLQATAFDGHLYDLPVLAVEVRRCEALGLSTAQAQEAVNLSRVLERLLAAGAKPAGKGAGHVMRRFALRLFNLATNLPRAGDWQAKSAALSSSDQVATLIAEEGSRRLRSHDERVAAARAHFRRIPGSPEAVDSMVETYGLEPEDLASVLSATAETT